MGRVSREVRVGLRSLGGCLEPLAVVPLSNGSRVDSQRFQTPCESHALSLRDTGDAHATASRWGGSTLVLENRHTEALTANDQRHTCDRDTTCLGIVGQVWLTRGCIHPLDACRNEAGKQSTVIVVRRCAIDK